jgi:hypothetical protein
MVMKSTIAFALSIAVITCASAAHASSMRLSWSTCYGDGQVLNQDFACTDNSTPHVLVASFIPNMTSDTVNGNEIVIDIRTASEALPAWWMIKNAGSCRMGSLTVSPTPVSPNSVCLDEFGGYAIAALGAYLIAGPYAYRQARIIAVIVVPVTELAHVDPTQEYFSLAFIIDSAHSTGSDACSGCTVAAEIMLNSIKLTAGGADFDEFIGSSTGENYALWQGGVIPRVPTRATTWGAIKALYR